MPPSGSVTTESKTITIGLLEVQGAFLEHRVALQKAARLLGNIDIRLAEVRTADHVTDELDGLIIPGGESTTISIYLNRNGMVEPLKRWIETDGHVTWGTCAGMILLSKMTDNQKVGGQASLSVMDTEVSRNFFGRQVHSFESPISIKGPELTEIAKGEIFPGIFIRAPAIVKTLSPEVKILGTLQEYKLDSSVIVAAQQGNVLSTAFHPELTEDCSWHMYFLKQVTEAKSKRTVS